MPHSAPSVMLLWSILSSMEFVFLLHHLWRYDRFACLRWNSGRQPGAFKRVMTYSYLLSVPLLVSYSVIMASIKYKEGYIDLSFLKPGTLIPGGFDLIVPPNGLGVLPKPFALWPQNYKDLVLPAHICFSIAWSLEIVSHLEELTFWLFLLHQGPSQRDWFTSAEFRIWLGGSVLAVIGLPTITVLLRANPYKAESWTFFAGGVGSLLITLWFLVVLFKFPKFLKRVRNEGAEADVVVRLTTFDELNRIRVGFRFFFAGPLLILAVDGILPGYHPINTNQFWTDLLSMVGGIGCIVSSILTLLIFFPRSIAKEAGYKAKTVSLTSRGTTHNPPQSPTATYFDGQQPGIPMSPSNGSAILHQSSIGIAVTTDPVPMYQPSPTPGYGGPNGRSTTPNSAMMLNGVSGGYGGSGKSSYPYSYGHGGVGSEPAEWEMEEVRRHRVSIDFSSIFLYFLPLFPPPSFFSTPLFSFILSLPHLSLLYVLFPFCPPLSLFLYCCERKTWRKAV
ncbi:hypothetical protein FRC20_001268 [Serendipita sp. 405]|nr:hypothetical protein FRC15_001228 [Serendipita sp. 397]KAG8853325.1 hypothetical protein FRC20_001268 [Serendipita sp. 405]